MHIDRYERNWMRIGIITLVVFAAFVFIAGFALGFQVPGDYERVNPQTVTESGPFADPGIREISPGTYEAYIIARAWSFDPREITIPKGSKVTFYVTSVDVQHGFKLQGTNINMMVVPGQVSKLTAVFDKPGTYDYLCTEFCGAGHAAMYGSLTVEQ
jgi:cytochrome c oxidase subunit II